MIPSASTFGILVFITMYQWRLTDGAPIQITDNNVESMLIGKKATFMMFYGSKCEECEDIMPEWKRLADEWEGHPYGQIAQVDCETEGTEAICNYFQIQEIPTLVVGGSMEWDFYGGSYDFESLSEFAKESISKPICTARVPENCLQEDLAVLEPLQTKSTEELLGMFEKAQAKIESLYDQYRHDESKILNSRLALEEEMNKIVQETAGDYKFDFVLQELRHRIQQAASFADMAEDGFA